MATAIEIVSRIKAIAPVFDKPKSAKKVRMPKVTVGKSEMDELVEKLAVIDPEVLEAIATSLTNYRRR